MPERVSFASTDQNPQSAIAPFDKFRSADRNKLGAARKQVVSQRDHRSIAKSPRRARLCCKKCVPILSGKAFCLPWPAKLGPPNPAQAN